MPQEIEVWYLIPYFRKKISVVLAKKGWKQKDIAKVFGISEAAVTNYIQEKRGSKVTLPANSAKAIEMAAEKIVNGKDSTKVLYDLCEEFKNSRDRCKIHKRFDKSVGKNCDFCFK